MTETADLLKDITETSKGQFHDLQTILSYAGFLERVESNPQEMIRNSATYLKDAFEDIGCENIGSKKYPSLHWRLFDLAQGRTVPIIGAEDVQNEIYRVLNTFVKQGYSNKLIVLHGPNGSAKTSMIESITNCLSNYSESNSGAVYRFNWIFPTDKSANPQNSGEAGPLGFAHRDSGSASPRMKSFAHLEEGKIASKIHSEFKENPIFLIPIEQRKDWLTKVVAKKEGIPEEEVQLPPHILLSGLSKRNQEIYQQLLAAYNGDFSKVLCHVQIERFYYSKQYRVGISTVEPQMAIDAGEKQLTMDRNMANMPSTLHNISFHESVGPLVEANRGLLEFSDLLKRPVEAFKYLLSTVEKGTINLPTSTANLDIVFFATTNEKHLDGFKTLPDFASFRSRFELITAPYLLKASEEVKIYQKDAEILGQTKKITPHSIYLLSLWAVLTRLKQPDPEYYESKFRSLIARLDPHSKAKLYEGQSLAPTFKQQEEITFKELKEQIHQESRGTVVYEGRFGASPREIKSILYKAVQNKKSPTLTPMAIFSELEKIVKDRSVYEFLQLEPRGKYHQPKEYIETIKDLFGEIFEREATLAMSLVADEEYENLLRRYMDHVVAFVKKEKIYDRVTGQHQDPNNKLLTQVEEILKITGSVERHREGLLGKLAAAQLDNPDKDIEVVEVFEDYLRIVQEFYHSERKAKVKYNFQVMLSLDTDEERAFKTEEKATARQCFSELESRYGYDKDSAAQCLKFLLTRKKK